MPLYDCMLLLKPHVKKEALMDLVAKVGRHVYGLNGVLTEVKSYGHVQLGYGIKKSDGRFFQGQLMQMTMMATPRVNKELHYLNKEDRLLRWLLVKHRDVKLGVDYLVEEDAKDELGKSRGSLFNYDEYYDKEDVEDDEDDDEDDELESEKKEAGEVHLVEDDAPYFHAEADYDHWSRNRIPTSPSLSRPKLHSHSLSSCTSITSTMPVPSKPSTIHQSTSDPSPHPPPSRRPHQEEHLDHPSKSKIPSPCPCSHDEFQEKVLFLDSIGLDSLSLLTRHPTTISSASLDDFKSLTSYLFSFGFTSPELHRIINMCPEILSRKLVDVVPVFTFLLREVKVDGTDLKRVINRRPRLLASSVPTRLRPSLYFLQSIGIHEVNRHTDLLSCSVEDKFIPRIEYFQRIGFSQRDALSMFRKFPPLFCYSIVGNFEPKFNYFVVQMGRDLKELRKFPQYFSFSLERRIKPRHQTCVDNGVCFPLPVLLKTREDEFRQRLDLCCSSSLPLQSSPLWCTSPTE